VSWHRPAQSVVDNPINPETAGWTYSGVAIYHLQPDVTIDISLVGEECAVIPLVGSVRVVANSQTFERGGPPAYYPAESVAIEIRGSGQGTRQVNQLLSADVVGPERLMVVEVITPDGNWSSYPPHKHDEAGESECALEEIYYFRFDRPGAFGVHRAYTADRSVNETVTVRHGDVFLVPRGYHGPSAAAPGYPMYYLNAMAGPGPRDWLVSTDPEHAWLWELWATEAPDNRLPWR
jgi:5-deoxy-glucuronate isomerase